MVVSPVFFGRDCVCAAIAAPPITISIGYRVSGIGYRKKPNTEHRASDTRYPSHFQSNITFRADLQNRVLQGFERKFCLGIGLFCAVQQDAALLDESPRF